MWNLYLSACAATFYNGILDFHHILMTKGVNNELPMTRWYQNLKNCLDSYFLIQTVNKITL